MDFRRDYELGELTQFPYPFEQEPDDCIDLVCFAQKPWSRVFSRLEHLITRFANERRVYYVEAPRFRSDCTSAHFTWCEVKSNIVVVRPELPLLVRGAENDVLRNIVDAAFDRFAIQDFIAWYAWPEAHLFTDHLAARVVIADCQDEKWHAREAQAHFEVEARLFQRSDLVLTSDPKTYLNKKALHHKVLLVPNSFDASHFANARFRQPDPVDQRSIAWPRVGYFGTVDERIDFEFVALLARLHMRSQFIFVGPCEVSSELKKALPSNVHFLGPKAYTDLPSYASNWDATLLPFRCSTRAARINPALAGEFLATGKPVIAAAHPEIVHPFGEMGLLEVCRNAEHAASVLDAVFEHGVREDVLEKRDVFTSKSSWEATCAKIMGHVDGVAKNSKKRRFLTQLVK